MKCVTAIASSTGIAGWAIWQSYGFAWGLIIAISQVITAVKHLLPYAARRAATNDACKALERLFVKAESDWYYIAEGILTNEHIHKKTVAIKKGKLDIVGSHFSTLVLPLSAKYEAQAASDATNYFNTLYFKENGNV